MRSHTLTRAVLRAAARSPASRALVRPAVPTAAAAAAPATQWVSAHPFSSSSSTLKKKAKKSLVVEEDFEAEQEADEFAIEDDDLFGSDGKYLTELLIQCQYMIACFCGCVSRRGSSSLACHALGLIAHTLSGSTAAPRSRRGSFSFLSCSLTEILMVMRVSGVTGVVVFGAAMVAARCAV